MCSRSSSVSDRGGGFFIGDGTGVGKGREIASIILDNVAQGRYRSIWVSLSTALFYDAKRDFRDLGRADINVYPLHKLDTSWTRFRHVLDTSS